MKTLYKDLRFKTEKEFKKWLNEKADKKIIFFDAGQDLLEIHIDERGEILHCNLQASVWNGLFVRTHPDSLCVGMGIEMNLPDKGWRTMDFTIEQIINLKGAANARKH